MTLPRTQANELARLLQERARRQARDSFLSYAIQTTPGFKTPWHVRELASYLEDVAHGRIMRLMIVWPPRHGKSLPTSQRFPAWYMGNYPTDQLIHASYGGELVAGFGRRLRNLMNHQDHLNIFPEVQLSVDSKAADLWHTKQDGVYCAAGVGGAITGRGADVLLIDDPVKSREEAESETMRNRLWDWYLNDAYTRLMPGGRVILIQTRWHDDDLAGRLLRAQEEGTGDEWVVLHHPALDATGAALWPDQYSAEALDHIRRVVGPRTWQALYQGDPTPDEGTYFTRDQIRYGVPPPISDMKVYGASDYAVTEGDGDWTVHLVVGLDPQGRLWILDLWRRQTTPDQWVPSLLALMRRWRPIVWAEETAHIEKSVGPFITRSQIETQTYCRRMQFSSAKAKDVKARAIQAYCYTHGLWMPDGAYWAGIVEKELLQFPLGVHDDTVDCLSLIGRMLEGLMKGNKARRADEDPTLAALAGARGLAVADGLPGITLEELASMR